MFVDLEKAFDRVLRVLTDSSLRRKGVVECYVNAVMKMYQEVLSQVKVEGVRSESRHTSGVNHIAAHLCCDDGCGDRGGGKGRTCPDVCI